jgi:type I restriction enzyme S subunit
MEILKLQMQSVSRGTTQDNMSLDKLLTFDFRVPPLPEQRRIAGILSAYDELMENSQRRIRIVESMARALYREWFVLFRYPGHESVPRVDSPLGPIPKGWEVKRLDALVEIKGGKQLEKEDIHEAGEFPVFGGNGIQGYSEKATHRGFVIAFGRVGAYCGAIHWSYSGAWLNNNSSSVVPIKHDELVLHHLLHFNFTNLRGGSAQPFISNTALAGIELVFPGDALAAKFCSLVKPLRLQRVALEKQIKNLRQTRDLLLPRLLSGQVAFSEK